MLHNQPNNPRYSSSSSSSSAAAISRKVSAAVRTTAAAIQRISSERGKTLGRSLSDLVLRHNAALMGCTSQDVDVVSASLVHSPRDYEFSCTSSPPPALHRRRNRRRRHDHHRGRGFFDYDYAARPMLVLRSVEDWNDAVESTTTTTAKKKSCCGGGGDEVGVDEFHVDKAAEEFIQRFYRELLLQKWTAPRD